MKKTLLIVLFLFTISFAYSQDNPKYDYIRLTDNMSDKVMILDNGEKKIYVDDQGKKYSFIKELDIVIEQLEKKGFEFVETYVITSNLYILLRKKIE